MPESAPVVENLLYRNSEQVMVVYLLTNLVNSKCFVGKTKRPLFKRIQEHFFNIRKKDNPHLYYAITSYGSNNFDIQILGVTTTINDLNMLEKLWISILQTTNQEIGYNICLGGEGAPGLKSEEHRRKLALSRIGKKRSPEVILKVKIHNLLLSALGVFSERPVHRTKWSNFSLVRNRELRNSPSYRATLSKANQDKVYICNGKIHRKVHKDEPIPEG